MYWNNYGKLDSLKNDHKSLAMKFRYDPMGNRIEKRLYHLAGTGAVIRQRATHYVRDAQGNPLAVYELLGGDTVVLNEFNLYGSSRLGMLITADTLVCATCTTAVAPSVYLSPVGNKRYELSNHLGNVMTVISDKITPIDTTNDGLWDYFNPSLVSATDYYPFGMLQPGRNFSSSEYRYGFNSQEKVDEISGSGNHTTAEFWEYDTRLVRRWNIDPVVKPWESGYAVMGNNPIWNKDPNGDDFVNVHTERKKEAKEKVDEAASNLENAKEGFKSFEGMTKKNAKAAGVLKEFKQARSELNTAQKNFNKADATYNQEVEYEAIVNDVLNQFKSVNPEKFAEFDKFDPFNRGIIDIHVSAQNAEIQMLDKNGFPTGRTTVEGINARLGNANHKEDYVRVRLKVIKVDGIVKLQSMTGSLVHGLGHIEGGKRQDETHAVKFKKEQFDDKLKKN